MAYQSQDIIRHSAINGLTPAFQARDFQEEVARLIDVITYVSYKACQVACSEWNDIHDTVDSNIGVYDNLDSLNTKSWTVMRFSEVKQSDKLEWLIHKDSCMHCFDSGYLKVYPAGGAIIQHTSGIVDFQPGQCIGCDYYIAGCPFDTPRLDPEDNHVYKCTLCVDCVVIGREPTCVKACPTDAVHFDTRESMKTPASEHVTELKARGYGSAGLCDPAGTDNTHVIYVLRHVDKSDLHHGLPENPEINETAKFWKGVWKPFVAVGFTTTLTTSILHYVSVGPNRADEERNNLHEERGEERK